MANEQTLNPNTTTSNELSAEMKTYYADRLIDNAEPYLVHDQFGDSYPIPAHGGKTIEFRRFSPLDKALDTLTEGVTPGGNTLEVTAKTGTVAQYGDYITVSDVLETTAIDRTLEQATKLLGSQAGRTLDTVTREVITAGTNVLYAPKSNGTEVLSRAELDGTCLLTPNLLFRAAAKLYEMNAMPVDENFVAIIHPNAACDIMTSTEWLDVHKYAEPGHIYRGEIGKLANIRFVQSTEAKIVAPAAIQGSFNRLTVKTAISESTTSVTVSEVLKSETPAEPIPVYIDGVLNTVTAITNNVTYSTLTVGTAIASLAAGSTVCGTGAMKNGNSVYLTMVIGANAYGVTELAGGGLRHIVKQLGSGGSSDPLDQRATTGWKATKTAVRLVEENMIRLEHASKTNATARSN